MGLGSFLSGAVKTIGAAPLVGAGASILGSAFSNSANAKEGKTNRRFQRNMSNTAHQRETADLEAAGLNRILSLSSGGASTPAGAPAQHQNVMQGASQTALQASQTGKTNEETLNVIQQTALTEAQIPLTAAQAAQLHELMLKTIVDRHGSTYELTRQRIQSEILNNDEWLVFAQEIGAKAGTLTDLVGNLLNKLQKFQDESPKVQF